MGMGIAAAVILAAAAIAPLAAGETALRIEPLGELDAARQPLYRIEIERAALGDAAARLSAATGIPVTIAAGIASDLVVACRAERIAAAAAAEELARSAGLHAAVDRDLGGAVERIAIGPRPPP